MLPAATVKICVPPLRVSSVKPAIRAVLAAVLFLPLALAGGCSQHNDPAQSLADYNTRLARLLDVEAPPAAAIRVPTWPSPLAMEPVGKEVRIDLFGFPDAGRCGLLQEISERGSALVRVQSSSQDLLRQMRLLRGLSQCAGLTAGDVASTDVTRRAFAVGVHDALMQKRASFPLVYWNDTFGSNEFREFFSVGVLPLRMDETTPAVSPANAISWLSSLGRLRQEAPLPAPDAIEQQYYHLVGNKMGGRVWLSIDLAMRELDRGSSMLEHAAPSALCPGGRPGTRAERLHELFDRQYAPHLQPWLAATGRGAGMLADALDRLWAAQQAQPPPEIVQYRQRVWADEPGSLVHDYDIAVQRHTRAWQALLEPCGYAAPSPAE